MGRQTLAAGVVIGADLAFWSETARFAGSLTAEQRYLPGIVQENGRFLRKMAAAIVRRGLGPAFHAGEVHAAGCAGLTVVESERPPDRSPVALLNAFVGTVVDLLVRGYFPYPAAKEQTQDRLGGD